MYYCHPYSSWISIHALREEGDQTRRRGRAHCPDISIHALREEGDHQLPVSGTRHWTISIHALREEGDPVMLDKWHSVMLISIHALREEGDRLASSSALGVSNFNPRPPRGGRPCDCVAHNRHRLYFNPRPPRGGRPAFCSPYGVMCVISIHALREEGDHRSRFL